MGRVKLEIKKIEKRQNLQSTYSKRSRGLIKKAFELSVLCDVDVAVIMFSPADRLSLFCRKNRIEDIITRFANTPRHMRSAERQLENLECLNNAIRKLHSEREMVPQQPVQRQGVRDHNRNVQKLRSTIQKVLNEKEYFETQARLFEGLGEESVDNLTSMSQLTTIERELEEALAQIRERKLEIAENDLNPREQNMFQHGSFAQMMTEIQNEPQGGTSSASDGRFEFTASSEDGCHMKAKRGDSESSTPFLQGLSHDHDQAQQLPLAVHMHGNQAVLESPVGDGLSHTNLKVC